LLATAIEQCEPVESMRLARITVELLGPVPIGELTVEARIVRPGRRVRLLEATITAADKRVAIAHAWQIATQPGLLPPQPSQLPPPVPPEPTEPQGIAGAWTDGYAATIDWRFVSGGFNLGQHPQGQGDQRGAADARGRAAVWSRVEGDQPGALDARGGAGVWSRVEGDQRRGGDAPGREEIRSHLVDQRGAADAPASADVWSRVEGDQGRGGDAPGRAEVWSRVRLPLIEDQPLTGLQRLLITADSANGVSARLPFKEWLFVPTSLTVTIQRHPRGEWTFMRALTNLATDGIGTCHADLADSEGFLGTASQPLVVARRTPS
jgi:hypothetical protein